VGVRRKCVPVEPHTARPRITTRASMNRAAVPPQGHNFKARRAESVLGQLRAASGQIFRDRSRPTGGKACASPNAVPPRSGHEALEYSIPPQQRLVSFFFLVVLPPGYQLPSYWDQFPTTLTTASTPVSCRAGSFIVNLAPSGKLPKTNGENGVPYIPSMDRIYPSRDLASQRSIYVPRSARPRSRRWRDIEDQSPGTGKHRSPQSRGKYRLEHGLSQATSKTKLPTTERALAVSKNGISPV